MPFAATSRRAARLCVVLLTAAISLSGQSVTPVAATDPVDWRTCAARPVPLPAARAIDPTLAKALTAKVVAWQKARRTRHPGVSVAIRWDDGRSLTAAVGVGDTKSRRTVTPSMPFAIASTSKAFTAAVALLLDHCGILPLSTRASTLVPEAEVKPEVTIAQLLLHRSGMSDWLTDKDSRMGWLSRNQNAKVTPLTAVQGLLPPTTVGSFSYSNSGFTLVTIAAERATGVAWKTLVQSLLLDPMNMTETGWGPKVGAARPHMGGKPYGFVSWGPSKAVGTALRGAGDMLSTPRDLARFGELFWGNRLTEGEATLAMNGIAYQTWSSWLYNYGTQVDRTWLGDLRGYGHNGGFSGVTSSLKRIPTLGITIAAVANGSPATNLFADDLVQELFKMIDQPAVDGSGVPRLTAADSGDPEPPDAPVVLPADYCGDPTPSSTTDALAARWIALGSSAGWVGSTTTMAELPDGRLVVGGTGLTKAAGKTVAGLAVRDPRTGAWQALSTLKTSTGRVASVYALAVDASRNLLYVAGNFSSVTRGNRRVAVVGIAQFNLKTGIWSKVGTGLSGKGISVRTLSLDAASGNLLIGGHFTRAGGVASANIATWSPARKRWLALGTGLKSDVVTAALAGDGTVYAAGRFVDGLVSTWNPTTKVWSVIGDARLFSDLPTSMVVDSLGHPLIGRGVGWYGDAVQVIEPAAPGGWIPLGGGVSYPRRTSWVTAMATLSDGTVAVGGYFAKAGALDSPNLALWDPITQRYTTIGTGLAIEPDALASSAFGTLYAATRVRSAAPGGNGGRCIGVWATQAPAAPVGATLTAGRGTIRVNWTLTADSTEATGWIATATAKGRTTRSCTLAGSAITQVADAAATCTITGLVKGVTYKVTLVAWSAPAGPSPRVELGTVKTLR
jgi:CubicO group peptidase (beta-lactamase class C family)